MHNSEERNVLGTRNTPGIHWYSASQLLFSPFPLQNEAFPSAELLFGHQWEDGGCSTGRLRVEMCEMRSWKWHSADVINGMVIGEVGTDCWGHRGKSTGQEQRWGFYGTADALQQFSSPSQQPTASVINRKGSHVNFDHLSNSAEHTCTITHSNAHTHTNYVWDWSESKCWFGVNQRRAGQLAATLQRSACSTNMRSHYG